MSGWYGSILKAGSSRNSLNAGTKETKDTNYARNVESIHRRLALLFHFSTRLLLHKHYRTQYSPKWL